MTLDHDTNPLSFPLLDYLSSSPSLVYTLQSISAGYEHYFKPSKLELSLEERSKALRALREELDDYGRSPISAFLTGYLLGMSSSYVDESVFDYGKEHLFATRQFVEDMLSKPEPQADQWINYGLGAYIYWDMTCSMLLDPHEQRPLNTPLLYGYISQMHLNQHPITGHCTELFYLLGHLGRHCRSVVELGYRDVALEVTLEEELVQWKIPQHDSFWTITANSFRHHGLIMLYRICGRQTGKSISGIDNLPTTEPETELIISDYARSTVESLSEIPMSSPFLNMQAIPLMTAGAELNKEYTLLRQQVVARFKALYSFNRLPTNLLAIQLLEEVWEARDIGISFSWLELMLLKKWRLRLG